MKRLVIAIASILILISMTISAMAEDGSRAYNLVLSSNGQSDIKAAEGDIITVMLTLERTDSQDPSTIYAMQSEIQYDPGLFKLVENSLLLGDGIQSTEIGMRDGNRRLYMNFVSMSGGVSWPSSFTVGSFQLEVIGSDGISSVTNEDYLVSTKDGKDTYTAQAENLKVALSEKVIVDFDTNGGSNIPQQEVFPGETVNRPADPARDNFNFNGWYSDLDLNNEWDFDNNIVEENTDLYAGWSDETIGDDNTPLGSGTGNVIKWWVWVVVAILIALVVFLAVVLKQRKIVTFISDSGTPISTIKVWKNKKIVAPDVSLRDDKVLIGWYRDIAATDEWDFNNDKITDDIMLYGKWA